MSTVRITAEALQPWSEVAAREREQSDITNARGACSVFVGSMRDFNEGDQVTGMTLEHYPGMTDRHLERIVAEAEQKWDLLDVLVTHRVGDLDPGEPIVLVAVWSAHRKDAFEACRTIMEELKSRAPFWKKERLVSGSRWVEKNTAGY